MSEPRAKRDSLQRVVRRYTIHEVKLWLVGGLFTREDDLDGTKCIENVALLAMIRDLQDREDGLDAVTRRFKRQLKKAYKVWPKLKPNIAVSGGGGADVH